MSERLEAWKKFCELQNEHNDRDETPEFNANAVEYAPLMAGFYFGWGAATKPAKD